MIAFIKQMFSHKMARHTKRKELQELLKKCGLSIVYIKNTSITLGCFGVMPTTKRNRVNLTDPKGNILEANIKEADINKVIKQYEDAAKKQYPDLPKDKALAKYVDEFVVTKKFRKRVDELFNNPKFVQLNGKKYQLKEVESAVDIERIFGGKVRASKEGEAGDFILEGGDLAGKSIDAMGLYNSSDIISDYNSNYSFWLNKFKNSVDKHFRKIEFPDPSDVNKASTAPLDFVAIDFRYFNEVNPRLKKDILDYIDDPTYIYSNYVKNNLIKLNL